MKLTPKQFEAANLIFDGQMLDKEVAAKLEVDERTIRRWRTNPDFMEEIFNLQTAYIDRARTHVFAVKEARLVGKMDRLAALNRIVEERAANADPNIPGAGTGLLLKQIRTTRDGDIVEYRLDTAICREMARLEADIARDLQQEEQAVGPEDYARRPEDRSALTEEESAALDNIIEKLAPDNPWLLSPHRHPMPNFEVQRIEKLIAARTEEKAAKKTAELAQRRASREQNTPRLILSGDVQ